MTDLTDQVKQANKEYHDSISTEEYRNNPSIFGPERQKKIVGQLENISESGERFLDIGCGTGNLIRIADQLFESVYGIDISFNMVQALKQSEDILSVAVGDAERLPFPDEQFDVVSFYATLHHFPDPKQFLSEGERVLKKGGYLYTDHDPNYYLMRFYYPLYKLLHWGGTGFGSERGDLAEYYHTMEPGIDPEPLANHLKELGFRSVKLNYRNTDNESLSTGKRIMMNLLEPLAESLGWRSFHTHFSIVAQK